MSTQVKDALALINKRFAVALLKWLRTGSETTLDTIMLHPANTHRSVCHENEDRLLRRGRIWYVHTCCAYVLYTCMYCTYVCILHKYCTYGYTDDSNNVLMALSLAEKEDSILIVQ